MVLDAEEQLDASFRNTGQRYCLIPQTCHGLNEAKSREASVVSFVLELELAVVSRPLENAEESRGERLLEAWRIPRILGFISKEQVEQVEQAQQVEQVEQVYC